MAASTDFYQRRNSSLLRGAALGLPYALLMFLFLPAVNGNITYTSSTDQITLAIDGVSVFFFCLLWGMLFGLFGASLKLGQGHWRQMASRALVSSKFPQITASLTGALAAIGLGLALALLVILPWMTASTFQIFSVSAAQPLEISGAASWQESAASDINQGPLLAANLFMYSFNAPLKLSAQTSGGSFGGANSTQTLNILGGTPHASPWLYLLPLIPIISLFLGGRVSAAFGRSRGVGPGMVQGLLITVPFTLLMVLIALFCTFTQQYTGSDSSSGILTIFAGVEPVQVLLWSFLSSFLLGALGGAYQGSSLKNSGSAFLRTLATPLRAVSKPATVLGERLSGKSHGERPTAAAILLYNACFWTIVLIGLTILASILLLVLNQTFSLDQNHLVTNVLTSLLIALPGLLLLYALAATLTEEPAAQLRAAQPTGAQCSRVVLVLLLLLTLLLISSGVVGVQIASQHAIALSYPKPHVAITSNISNDTHAGNAITFVANGQGHGLSYSWDFGDQTSATGPNVSHAYSNVGDYTVTLTATDGIGQQAENTLNVSIVSAAPSAAFTFTIGDFGDVSFDAGYSTVDPSLTIDNYHWDFFALFHGYRKNPHETGRRNSLPYKGELLRLP